MKKRLVFFVLVCLSAQGAFSQKMPYTAQEFGFRDVELKEDLRPMRPRLSVSLKITGKFAQSQIEAGPGKSYPDYALKFWLASENGDTLVSPQADPSLLQRFSFFSSSDPAYGSYSFGHSLSFPYPRFRKTGKMTAVLWARPQSPDGNVLLKPLKVATYTLTVPKLYPLAEQKISLKNVEVSERDNSVILRYTCQLAYNASELYDETEDSDELVFFAEFTLPDGGPATLVNDPRLSPASLDGSQYSLLRQQKNVPLTGEIKLPYTQFFLAEGPHELNYVLHAVSKNKSRRWENLYRGKCVMHMPPVYFAKVAVTGLEVAHRTYDVAAKDIPIISLFVSNKGSGGKGYPDLFWTFTQEGRTLISTRVGSNSFLASDDSCFFQMLENDRLSLHVYDYDLLSRNDFLGGLDIPRLSGEATYRMDKLVTEDIVAGQIRMERKKRPVTPKLSLSAQTVREQGVSGYRIWGKSSENDPQFHTRLFLRLADGSNGIPAWRVENPPEGADFSYFMPAWELPKGAKVGLLLNDTRFGLPLAQYYATPDRILTESDDVSLAVTAFGPATRNGVHGIRCVLHAKYPPGLGPKDMLRFLYTLRGTDGSELNGLPAQTEGAVLCPGNECDWTLFIPYHLLTRFAGSTLHTVLRTDVRVARNGFSLGRGQDTLNVAVPTLSDAPKMQFETPLKFKKNWTYIELASEYAGNRTVWIKERTEAGKLVQEITFPVDRVYEKDTLSIILTPYEFRSPLPPLVWKVTAGELLKSPVLPLKKTPQTKKPVLKTH